MKKGLSKLIRRVQNTYKRSLKKYGEFPVLGDYNSLIEFQDLQLEITSYIANNPQIHLLREINLELFNSLHKKYILPKAVQNKNSMFLKLPKWSYVDTRALSVLSYRSNPKGKYIFYVFSKFGSANIPFIYGRRFHGDEDFTKLVPNIVKTFTNIDTDILVSLGYYLPYYTQVIDLHSDVEYIEDLYFAGSQSHLTLFNTVINNLVDTGALTINHLKGKSFLEMSKIVESVNFLWKL